ncbi:MAG: peptidylprolyl isomerase [Deltaproteobacteria bacterium]|nr:peptidylprolyl isomerase [Deltaproteobacteria bacterium]
MHQAKKGDRVRVHYSGKLDDGFVFDSSLMREPLEFTIGAGELILAFEEAVIGMWKKETKSFTVPANDAYGSYDEKMLMTAEIDKFPPDVKIRVGEQLELTKPGGHSLVVTVTKITDNEATLDANHPLAGKDLTFDIELVEIL